MSAVRMVGIVSADGRVRVMTCRVVSLLAACLLTIAGTALAEQPLDRTAEGYPSRPLMVMAPANPGGGWDQTSRIIQHVLVTRRIVPVSVEVFNRGGAGGTIGLAELLGRHRRNPHVVMTAGAVMMGAIAAHRSPFTMKDTVPIARLINEYEVVAIPSSSSYRSLRDLLAAWKAAPRSMTWAGGSAGGLDHILVGQLARSLGIASADVRYIAFAGGAEAAAAVMGGQVSAGISGYAEWKGLADTGRMRMLATSSPARIGKDGPPTFHEQGVDLTVANWRCVLAPPGTTPSARAWLVDALRQMRGTAEWQAYLKNNYWEDSFLDGPEFERFLDQEMVATRRALASINLGEAGRGYAAVGPWTFPSAALALLVLASIAVLRGSESPAAVRGTPIQMRPLIATAALLAAYVAAFEGAGFVLATTLFMTLTARTLGGRSWARDLLVSCVVAVGAYLLFDRVLGVTLP